MPELAAVPPADRTAAEAARHRLGRLAKPPGSLGRIEDLAVRLAAGTGRCPPPVPRHPALLVACGDHGVHARGVSPWPQTVSRLVAEACCRGQATAAVFAEVVGAEVCVLDVGLREPAAPHPRLRARRVVAGTADLTVGPALTDAERDAAVAAGATTVEELIAGGTDLLLLGEVGIANTTPSACLAAALLGAAPEEVTGRGTGIDDATWQRKVAVVRRAVDRVAGCPDPWRLLAEVGGAEHAALVGAILAAARHRVPVLLDGVTTCVAALAAVRIDPAVVDHLIAGHRSPEPAAGKVLASLGLDPLLDLGMRLGEGTGALLALPLVVAAARLLRDVATIEEVLPGDGALR